MEEGNGIIVPIVIGALIAVVVLGVVVFFFLKRKTQSNKYSFSTSRCWGGLAERVWTPREGESLTAHLHVLSDQTETR